MQMYSQKILLTSSNRTGYMKYLQEGPGIIKAYIKYIETAGGAEISLISQIGQGVGNKTYITKAEKGSSSNFSALPIPPTLSKARCMWQMGIHTIPFKMAIPTKQIFKPSTLPRRKLSWVSVHLHVQNHQHRNRFPDRLSWPKSHPVAGAAFWMDLDVRRIYPTQHSGQGTGTLCWIQIQVEFRLVCLSTAGMDQCLLCL